MAPDETYRATLTLYYEEEVEGAAYFDALAARFEAPEHREKLHLLADVERHAAKAVAPLIARHALEPRATADLVASGIAEARATPPEWDALMAEMRRTYPAYVDAFRTLERLGPPDDLQRLSFLTEHEVAALRFLEAEARDPAASAAPLRAYLAASPESWRGAAA